MIDKVKEAIDRHSMLTQGQEGTLGLSGGADSTALLLALRELGYKVSCVHVNHNLRGEEALRDQRFCEELCSSLSVELAVESVDVREYADVNKLSLEEAARELRYNALFKHTKSKLATAHNLNDSFETTLFNLTRGTALGGILGIPPVRDNIIRPLIYSTRQEILDFLDAKNQPWVEDSTNQVADCSRNILRLEVVPKLLEINQGLYRSYGSFLSTVGEAKSYLDEQILSAYNSSLQGQALDVLSVEEGALRSGAVSLHLKYNGVSPTHDRVSLILSSLDRNTKITLVKGVYAKLSSGKLTVERDSLKQTPESLSVSLTEDFYFDNKRVSITKLSQLDISRFNKNTLKYAVDMDKLHGELIARSCVGGEKIRLLGRGFSSTLKKLFSDPVERPHKLVLADGRGAFFAEDFGIDERVCCDENTTHAVKIDII